MDIIDKIIAHINQVGDDSATGSGGLTMEYIDSVDILEYKKHAAGVVDIYAKPWSKLNHSQKINRINLFCNKLILQYSLGETVANDLKSLLMDNISADLVEYDSTNAVITKITGLKVSASGVHIEQDTESVRSNHLSDFSMIPLSLEKLSLASGKKKVVVKKKH